MKLPKTAKQRANDLRMVLKRHDREPCTSSSIFTERPKQRRPGAIKGTRGALPEALGKRCFPIYEYLRKHNMTHAAFSMKCLLSSSNLFSIFRNDTKKISPFTAILLSYGTDYEVHPAQFCPDVFDLSVSYTLDDCHPLRVWAWRNDLTFSQLANKVGISPVKLSAYLCGRVKMPENIAKHFRDITHGEVSVADLLSTRPVQSY